MINTNLHTPGTFNSLFKSLNSINGILALCSIKSSKKYTNRALLFHCVRLCVSSEHSMSKTSLNVFGLITTWFFILFGLLLNFSSAPSLHSSYKAPSALMLACFYLMMKFLPFLLLILLFFFSCLFSLSNREKRKSSQTFRIKIILFMCEVRGMRNNSKEDFSREEKSFFSHFFPSSLIATKTFTPGEWIKFYHRASLRIKEKSRVGTVTKMFSFSVCV